MAKSRELAVPRSRSQRSFFTILVPTFRATRKLSIVRWVSTDKRACIESSGQFSGDTAKRKFSQKRRRRRKTAFRSGVHELRRRFIEPYVFRLANAACKVLPIVVIHCWSLNIGNFLSRRRLVVSLSVSHAGNWGKILILFRHTLH